MRNKALEKFLNSYVQDNYPELVNESEFIKGLKISSETFNDNNTNFSIFDILPKTEESIDFLDDQLKKVFQSTKKIQHKNYIKTYNVRIGNFPNYYDDKYTFLSYNDALKSLQNEIKKLIDSDKMDSLHRYDFNITESNITKEQLINIFSEEYLINFYGKNWKEKINF